MSNKQTGLIAEFPRAMRGYAPSSVDDFVRQLSGRLENQQTRLDEQTAKVEKLQTVVDTANRDLTAFLEKEMAIANSFIAMEQRRVVVEQELEIARANARLEAEQILMNARREAEDLVNSAKQTVEEIIGIATANRERNEERLRSLCLEYDDTATHIRRTLEAQIARLPVPGETLSSLSISGMAITSSAEDSQTSYNGIATAV